MYGAALRVVFSREQGGFPPRRIISKYMSLSCSIAPEPVTIHMQHKTNARQRRSPAHRTASIEIGLEQYTHSPKRRLKDCCVEGSACSHSARHAWWKGLAQPSHSKCSNPPSARSKDVADGALDRVVGRVRRDAAHMCNAQSM